jgi:hypothetical protein
VVFLTDIVPTSIVLYPPPPVGTQQVSTLSTYRCSVATTLTDGSKKLEDTEIQRINSVFFLPFSSRYSFLTNVYIYIYIYPGLALSASKK